MTQKKNFEGGLPDETIPSIKLSTDTIGVYDCSVPNLSKDSWKNKKTKNGKRRHPAPPKK